MANRDPSVRGHTVFVPSTSGTVMVAPCQLLVNSLLQQSLVLAEDWDALSRRARRRVVESPDEVTALDQLVKLGLLTKYQAGRIEAGTTFGLVLGSYRVLDRLGAGGMAVVFKAEHMDLRHHVAVKVLPPTTKEDSALESRFFAEMRIVARLRHPNIVAATDAGRAQSDDGSTVLRYLVMDHVPGEDLEETVRAHGALSPARACAIAYQVAAALVETHKCGLVHRDIKPSNVMLTGEDHAKLLDFGLTRHFGQRMTVPGTVLGTIDYMAPEQARDASAVDIRADIFSLGGTLYWCLTGQVPFPFDGSPVEALTRRLTAPAPSVRAVRPDLSIELDAFVARMMALRPEERYCDPGAVMQALLPFVRTGSGEYRRLSALSFADRVPLDPLPDVCQSPERGKSGGEYRILVVDDERSVRELCKQLLRAEGATVELAATGTQGLAMALGGRYDLLLIDVNMPDITGIEVLNRVRQEGPDPTLKVLMFSGQMGPEEMSDMLSRGADDFLTKPFSVAQFIARVQNLLRLKAAQDRAARLNRHLATATARLERDLADHSGDVSASRNAVVLAVARMIDRRDGQETGHAVRMQRYCRTLAEAAAALPSFAGQIDGAFVDLLESCAPLHDLGRIELPDHLLLSVGQHNAEERLVMETHTSIGADALQGVMHAAGAGQEFVRMAADVARHHHERYDGTGYPDRLAGDAIPLAARFVALADRYDALRRRRLYKPALSHTSAIQILTQSSPGHFDPELLAVFQQEAEKFDSIFNELSE